MEYTGMINKYAPKIMELRDMENSRADMKAGYIVMQIMDETMKEVKDKVGNLYSELIMKQTMKESFQANLLIDVYHDIILLLQDIKIGEFKMSKEEIIATVICTVLGSSALNGLLTHILYNNKLKKELKNKGNDMIVQEIISSLQYVRDMELKLTTQEVYDIENELDKKGCQINLFEGECIYPAIFNDWESYNQFMDMVHECRSKHEKNLSVKVALNLVFIDRYIKQLSLFMSDNSSEDWLPFWGTIFIIDLQEWQKKMDRMLVKEINKYTYKLESHETRKWIRIRKKELIKQFEGTILYYLLNGKCNRKDRKRMEFISNFIQEIIKQDI